MLVVIGAQLIICAIVVQAAARVQVQLVAMQSAVVLKQHPPAQVTVEVLLGKHVETIFVVREKPLHRAQQIVVGVPHPHAALQIIGTVMILQAALV